MNLSLTIEYQQTEGSIVVKLRFGMSYLTRAGRQNLFKPIFMQTPCVQIHLNSQLDISTIEQGAFEKPPSRSTINFSLINNLYLGFNNLYLDCTSHTGLIELHEHDFHHQRVIS